MANISLPLKSLCAVFPIANRQSISCSEFKLYVPAIFVGSNELLNCNLPARRQLDGVVRTYWSQSGGQLLKFCQVTERIACYCGKKWRGSKWAAGPAFELVSRPTFSAASTITACIKFLFRLRDRIVWLNGRSINVCEEMIISLYP